MKHSKDNDRVTCTVPGRTKRIPISDTQPDNGNINESLRNHIIGLGKRSLRKSYYPELRQNLSRLERFRTLLDHSSEMILLVTLPDGEIIDANEAIANSLGQSVDTLTGCHLSTLGFAQAPKILNILAQDTKSKYAPLRRTTFTAPSRSGSLTLDLSYRVVTLEKIPYGVLTGRDAGERIVAETRLRLAANVFASSVESIIIADANSRIIDVNRAFEKVTGYSRDEAIGQKTNFMLNHQKKAGIYRRIREGLREHHHWQGEIWNRRKNGDIYPAWLSLTEIIEDTGERLNYVAMFSDITDSKINEARIEYMAHHDSLTGLPNRFLLNDRFNQISAAARHKNTYFALLFIDLDRFKNVNDTLGHSVGDRLLRIVAERLASRIRTADVVSRQGGDEFIVLLSAIKTPDDAAHVAYDLTQMLNEPCVIDHHELTITPSIGIAIAPKDGSDLDTLLKHADLAMYDAKRQGHNNFQFFKEEMDDQTMKLLVMENQLRQALKRQEFELFYQPQMEIGSGRVVAFEALLRWRHPEQGLVSPTDFIPLAEETGLILPLGNWVMHEACRQTARWRSEGWPDIRISVNLSGIQFQQPDLAGQVESVLESANLEASALELEVTESVVMQDVATAASTLHDLRAMGITVAVDDFGTGYSSLAYLKRFPVNRLKIDRSFVCEAGKDPEDTAICAAIIGLARNLHLDIIAEGVEHKEQLAWLRSAGCRMVQGFLIGKPLPASECLPLPAPS